MGELSKTLLDKATYFLVTEIQGRAIEGITYTLLLKDKTDKDAYDKCAAIIEEVKKCGYNNNEVFRVYEVSNGYICDLDISLVNHITKAMAKEYQKSGGNKSQVVIGAFQEKRRKDDMMSLAKHVKAQYDKGVKKIDVALFSRNTVPRIVINSQDSKGNPVITKYNAYAIRHWDIEEINRSLLAPFGIRISAIEPCEVLPSKTGVSFILHIKKI